MHSTTIFCFALLAVSACGSDPAPSSPEPTGDISADTGDLPEILITVSPYLQHVETDSAWILWEGLEEGPAWVEWGTSADLGQTATAAASASGDGVLYEAQLTGLSADTAYWYRAHTGATVSEVQRLRSAPDAESTAPFRLVAMSDMQRDDAHPTLFADIVQQGVIPWVQDNGDGALADELSAVLIPGDLVDNGWLQSEWRDDFFLGGAPLFSQVPVYPVPGNHEGNSPLFFQYFHLPEDGGDFGKEHWWSTRQGDVLLIGLDSNGAYRDQAQLDWLSGVLDTACADESIDFVVAELHHPHKSELWPSGETEWSGDVATLLENYTAECGPPTVQLYGHTHGYSRGQARDHRHLQVNVASAGGALDRWDGTQPDYEEFTVTEASYGFVVMDVSPGADPSLTLRRISQGTPDERLDNVEEDSVTVRRHSRAPETPVWTTPGNETTATLPLTVAGSPYSQDAGDAHGATHWQLSPTCSGLDEAPMEWWVQSENRHSGIDTQAGDDLTDHVIDELEPGVWCGRLRYRTVTLDWSAWSEPAQFAVSAD